MRIDIAAEIKFSYVAEGEYLVRLQDADQTIIGKLLRADGGWKSYSIEQDGSWKGSFQAFGTTRYEASRSLLETYELANGLRDSEGRRVVKELETNLWYVAEFTGVRRSPRWADKADAVAFLASLQEIAFEEIGRQAVRNDEPAAPISNEKVRTALAGNKVGDPENMRIMRAFQKGYEAERTAQADEVLHDMPASNTDGPFYTEEQRPATPADIVARLKGSQYPLTAIDALGWGMGAAQINIAEAVAEAERQGLVVTSLHNGKQMVALAEKTGNEYAAEAYIADQAGDMAAALWAVVQAWRVEPGQADRWRKLLRSYRGLPAVPTGTKLDDRGDVEVQAAEANALVEGYADARRMHGDEYADHLIAHDAELAAKGYDLAPWPASLAGNDGN